LQNSKSEIFEDYILPAVLIPLVPVCIGLQIVCLFVVRDFSRCVEYYSRELLDMKVPSVRHINTIWSEAKCEPWPKAVNF